MINGASAGAAGIEPFPDPPKGSPDGIRSAARSLRLAAEDLQSSHGTLTMAAGELGSWEGQAAVAYHACVEGLGKVIHGGVASLHAVAAVVSHYASSLEHAQSGIRRLRPLYDDAVRRARHEQGVVDGLAGSMPGATKSERKTLTGLITGAASSAQGDIDEANGYARHAQRLLDDFHREANADAGKLAPFEMQLFGGTIGQPIGTPGPGFGIGANDGSFPTMLAPLNGVIPVTLPQPKAHGESVFGQIMSGVQSISGIVTTVSGACSALLFWNGIGEGCGVVGGISSGIGASAGLAKAISGDGSVGSAAVGTVEALPGVASYRLARGGEDLVIAGEGFGKPAVATAGYTKKAVAGVLDGLGGTASSRGIADIGQGGGGDGHVSAGALDQATGRGIAAELAQIEQILAGPGVLGVASHDG